MWKFIPRRVRESFSTTCNVLEVGRTSVCTSPNSNQELVQKNETPSSSSIDDGDGGAADKQVLAYAKRGRCLQWFREHRCPFSGGKRRPEEENAGQERKEERERLNGKDDLGQSWLSALTWSGAVVCGWYTSQYVCMRRKRLGWNHPDKPYSSCMYGNLLMNTTRSLHTNVTSRIVFASPPTPPPPSPQSPSSLSEVLNSSSIGALLQNVNNPVEERETEQSSKEAELASDSGHFNSSSFHRSKSDRSSSASALAEFSLTIAEIEYQFAVQELVAENYKTAVDHLKLASTHHHPAATFNLGLCYERGLGVERDLNMAMKCYSVASSFGHPKAIYNLGVFYARGLGGLKRSRKAALECFVSAARLGQAEAQQALDMQKEREQRKSMPTTTTALKEVAYTVHAF